MIIANPKSGSGKSLKYLKEIVLPLLEQAGFRDIVVKVTNAPKHATQLALDIDPQTIGGILVLSGDGTLSEVINGLHQHPKQKEALAIPVGIVPTGSGVAMHQLLVNPTAPIDFYKHHDERDIVNCVLRICDWNTAPFQLFECGITTDEKENPEKIVAIILASFGIIPEFMRLAEKLRWTRLGALRYLLVSMYLIGRKKKNDLSFSDFICFTWK